MNQQAIFCDRCGEAIGAHEQVILQIHGETHETSQVAEPQLTAMAAVRYHRDCYHALTGPQTD